MSCARGCCDTQNEHYRSVVVAAGGASVLTTFERRLDRDRPAYKRLKDEGLQPARLMGAADLERRAQSRFEIEAGRILPDSQARRVDDAVKTAAEIGRAV